MDDQEYDYIYAGSRLVYMTISTSVDGGTATTDKLYFTYDANGIPYSMEYNGTVYYYITNLQGDVISIVNTSGTVVASYEYDPYGNVVSATGDMAEINPLKYRGYVYDTESELYYLQSRYYDPQIGRFINADVLASTGQGILGNNMFAYCGNNPVNYSDPDGMLPIWAIAAIGGGLGGALLNLMFYLNSAGDDATVEGAIPAMIIGAATGAIGGLAGTPDFASYSKYLSLLNAFIGAVYANSTGSSETTAFISNGLGTYLGTFFDLSCYSGFDLGTANYLFSVFSGFSTEIGIQAIQTLFEEVNNTFFSNDTTSTTPKYTGGSGGGGSIFVAIAVQY